jgi:hypothetical protein
MKKALLLLALLILAGCATTQQNQPLPVSQCKWPEIPSDGGCCRDLNANGACDTIDLSVEIQTQEQKEYEEAALKAQATANKSGRYKPTIMNAVYANASSVKNYRFYYKGDEVVVANGSIARRLTYYYPLGDQTVNGRKMKVFVNTVLLDMANKTAIGQCIPPENLVKEKENTPCDDIIGVDFDVSFDTFGFKMPIKWLEEFLYRTPAEILPGSHIAKRTAILYSFTDLQNSNRKTKMWADEQTGMPLRVEVTEGKTVMEKADYLDFFQI